MQGAPPRAALPGSVLSQDSAPGQSTPGHGDGQPHPVRMAEAGPINEDQARQMMLLDRFPGAKTLGKAFGSVELPDPRPPEQQEGPRSWPHWTSTWPISWDRTTPRTQDLHLDAPS